MPNKSVSVYLLGVDFAVCLGSGSGLGCREDPDNRLILDYKLILNKKVSTQSGGDRRISMALVIAVFFSKQHCAFCYVFTSFS